MWDLRSGDDGRRWQGTNVGGNVKVACGNAECYGHLPLLRVGCGLALRDSLLVRLTLLHQFLSLLYEIPEVEWLEQRRNTWRKFSDLLVTMAS
jgi:hypothetical protein